MSTIMMRHIYALPLNMVIFLMLALLIVWVTEPVSYTHLIGIFAQTYDIMPFAQGMALRAICEASKN